MGYGLIVLAVVAVAFSIPFIRRPDESWDLYESWKWQNPEANRPSRAALRLQGMGGLVVALISAGFGLWIIIQRG